MAKRISGSKHQLSGDWTISGVVDQVGLLSKSLQRLASAQKKCVCIDCGRIDSIDMSGLQLLHVWMECAKMCGVKAQLVNLPDSMQQTIQRLGLGCCFTNNYPDYV